MTYFPLTKQQQEWQERTTDIAARELAPRAEQTDKTGQYPQESPDALKRNCSRLRGSMSFLTTGDRRARYGTVAVNRVRPLKSEQLL